MGLPELAPASDNPDKKQSQSATEGIDQHIDNGSLPRRNKELVKLVARRIGGYEQQGVPRGRPIPFPGRGARRQGDPAKQRQDGVFGKVRAFARSKNDHVQSVL